MGLGHTDKIGDEAGEMGDNLVVTDVGGNPLSVQCGPEHVCAILDTNGMIFGLIHFVFCIFSFSVLSSYGICYVFYPQI